MCENMNVPFSCNTALVGNHSNLFMTLHAVWWRSEATTLKCKNQHLIASEVWEVGTNKCDSCAPVFSFLHPFSEKVLSQASCCVLNLGNHQCSEFKLWIAIHAHRSVVDGLFIFRGCHVLAEMRRCYKLKLEYTGEDVNEFLDGRQASKIRLWRKWAKFLEDIQSHAALLKCEGSVHIHLDLLRYGD